MIPQPIYALLPYIYMLIGLFGLIGLESNLGKLCGLLLIVAGIVVHQLRARYRVDNRLFGESNPKHSRQTEPSVAAAEPRSRRSMPEPRSRRSMPEPRSVRTGRPSSR